MNVVHLRPATKEDDRILWEWRNDPVVRGSAFNSEPIPLDDHRAWLALKLACDGCRIWILEDGGVAAGQVRYDRRAKEAEVDVSVAAEFRGRGLGVALLRLSARLGCVELGVHKLFALVKEDNLASRSVFQRAGYRLEENLLCAGHACLKFQLACQDEGD